MNYRKPCRKLTEAQAAYIAGILDGEGTLTASLRRSNLWSAVCVGSTSLELVKWLKQTTGLGVINLKKRREPNPRARDLYAWTVSTCSAASLLRQILPHLVIKRRQAKLMLGLLNVRHPSRLRGRRQARLVSMIKALNLRGRAAVFNSYGYSTNISGRILEDY